MFSTMFVVESGRLAALGCCKVVQGAVKSLLFDSVTVKEMSK